MNDNDENYRLLVKHLRDGLPEKEQAALFAWVSSSQENKELYFQVKDITDREKLRAQSGAPAAEVWDMLLQRRDEARAELPAATSHRSFYTYIRYAAAALLFVAISAGLYFYQFRQADERITITVAAHQPAKKVRLPDQSIVWLKPGSSLTYNRDFDQQERTVILTGEGFFEVAKVVDQQGRRKPFTVTSSNFTIAVLGTSFSVNDSAAIPSVIVRSGTVRTAAGNASRTLQAGDRAMFRENKLVVDKVNPELLTGWTTGEYMFSHTSIDEIKDLLETNYGQQVEVACNACFESISLTGRVYAGDEQAFLDILRVMLPAEIKKEGNKIVIKPTKNNL